MEAMHRIEEAGARLIAGVAAMSARYPARGIGLSLLCALVCAAGFARITLVSRGDELWVRRPRAPLLRPACLFARACPAFAIVRSASHRGARWGVQVDQNSIPKKHLDWVGDTYGAEPRGCELLFRGKTGSQSKNIVTRAALLELFEALDAVMAIEVSRAGKTYKFEDLCLKTVLGQCVADGPQRFWMSSKKYFESSTTTDADVQRQMGKSAAFEHFRRPRSELERHTLGVRLTWHVSSGPKTRCEHMQTADADSNLTWHQLVQDRIASQTTERLCLEKSSPTTRSMTGSSRLRLLSSCWCCGAKKRMRCKILGGAGQNRERAF
jgi:hypothetical protein